MLKKLLSYGASEGLAKGLNIATIMIMPLFMKMESYGIISLTIGLEQVLFSICLFGQNTTLLRYFSKFRRWKYVFYKSIAHRILLTSSVLCLLAIIILIYVIEIKGVKEYTALILTILAIPILVQIELFLTFSRARGETLEYISCRLTYQVIKSVVILTCCIINFNEYAYGTGVFISSYSVYFYIKYKNTRIIQGKLKKNLSKKLFWFGFPIAVHSIINISYSVADRYMLAAMLEKSDVAIYSLSYTIGSSLLFIANIFTLTYLPKIYNDDISKDSSLHNLKVMMSQAALTMIALAALLFFLIYPLFIQLYDQNYLKGENTVLIISISNFVHLLYLYGFYKMTLIKNIKFIPLISSFTLLINILLNYFLIPEYGINGAALSTGISESILAAFSCILAEILYNKSMSKERNTI